MNDHKKEKELRKKDFESVVEHIELSKKRKEIREKNKVISSISISNLVHKNGNEEEIEGVKKRKKELSLIEKIDQNDDLNEVNEISGVNNNLNELKKKNLDETFSKKISKRKKKGFFIYLKNKILIFKGIFYKKLK
jgi:hypothetical protein